MSSSPPPPRCVAPSLYVIVGLGWHRRCKTLHLHWAWRLLATTLKNRTIAGGARQPGYRFILFFSGHHDGYRVRSYCVHWRTLTQHKGNDRITQCEYGKSPTRQMHSNAHCCLCSGQTRKQSNSLVAVIHKQESRHKAPNSVLRAVL